MVQKETKLKVVDNTGAKTLLLIANLSSRSKFAQVGDIIVGTVKTALPSGIVKKGEVVQATIVRTVFPIKRKNGQTVTFNENAAVIISKNKNPRGTRIFGPVASELKQKGFDKIISLVSEVL